MSSPDARPFHDASCPPPIEPLFLMTAVAVTATALAMLTTAQAAAALAYAGAPVPWNGLLRARLVDWYAYAVFVPALVRLVRRLPVDRATWQTRLPFYCLLGLGVAVAKETIYVGIGNLFRPDLFSLPTILSEDFSSEAITAWAIIGIAHILVFRAAPQRGARDEPEAEVGVDRISIRDGSAWHLVRCSEIEWVEAQGNYARLATGRGRFMLRETMGCLERRLGPGFLRVHRRAIVNLAMVERLEPRSHGEYLIFLRSGDCITSSRTYNQSVRAMLQAASDHPPGRVNPPESRALIPDT